ncbi:hypothetical protein ACROYT_G030681, partial [Oculina patagonica]
QDLYDTLISFCKKKIHTITNHAFCSFRDNLNRRFARGANSDQPMNGGQYWPFPLKSATFYNPAELRSLPAGPEPAHDPIRLQSLILLARSTPSLPSPQSSVASDVEVLATANTK